MNTPWPQLRDELTLYPGPTTRHGAPTWSLHDPVRNLYFRIDWMTFEILSRWSIADNSKILEELIQETTLHVNEQSLQSVHEFLANRDLIKRNALNQSDAYTQEDNRRHTSALTWLLHHYLFFRLPLLKPDRWLTRTYPHVRWLASPSFAIITFIALCFGLLEASKQWDVFTNTLVDMFSLTGLVAAGTTLIGVKLLHELGHAYTAKTLGCKVPTMGIAFLVLFPMAYTDVNDAWKLQRQKDRLAVGAAGIVTELVIAVWATLAWAFLPDGALRNATFLLATTTWVSTLIINASPFLRFDGYFLLMDSLELPNLHQRSFALARWKLREWLFALKHPLPEYFTPRRHIGLIAFAWGTWIYRLIVFIGIAVLVYLSIPKPLGPLLALLEITWFIIRPIWNEVRTWLTLGKEIMSHTRILLTLSLVTLMIATFVVPWDKRVRAQALLQPATITPLVAPGRALVESRLVDTNSPVTADKPLLLLRSQDLEFKQLAAQSRAQALQWQSSGSGITQDLREQRQIIIAEQNKVAAELEGIKALLAQYSLSAPNDGTLIWENPDLSTGQWIAKNETLGSVIQMDSWQVLTYLTEYELDRVTTGNSARFYPESDRLAPLKVHVTRIDSDATRVLKEGILASNRGGTILVREQGEQLVPEVAIYRVLLKLSSSDRTLFANNHIPTLRGQLVIYGEEKSWMDKYWRSALALIYREAGF